MLNFLFSRRYNYIDVTALLFFGQAVVIGKWGWALGLLFGGAIVSAIGEVFLRRKNNEH